MNGMSSKAWYGNGPQTTNKANTSSPKQDG